MLINKGNTIIQAAEKSNMSEKTARKYLKTGKLPDELKIVHNWRTREDPFKEDEDYIFGLLDTNPALEAKTIFDDLLAKYPDGYHPGQLRTLQRKIKQWRALQGPAKEVIFPQIHYPGDRSESDFTDMSELNITINGQKFPHLVYHFILTYSNWQTGTICMSESFEALSEGLQNALWQLGGVPRRHQTDNLSAAVVNTGVNAKTFTERYAALMRHYRLESNRINPSRANENGDTEKSHDTFKKTVDQQLMLRGSRDFGSIAGYKTYLVSIFDKLNKVNSKKVIEEMAFLKPLPLNKLDNHKRETARVRKTSTVTINHNTYSVPSRLIGEKITAKLMPDTIEIWYAQRKVEELPRLKGRKKHFVQYRHIIDYLVRKPGAFENYVYKEDLFPTHRFRVAYDLIGESFPGRASKEYLSILALAARDSETLVDEAIEQLIREERQISFDAVKMIVESGLVPEQIKEVEVMPVEVSIYDQLLSSRCGEGAAA